MLRARRSRDNKGQVDAGGAHQENAECIKEKGQRVNISLVFGLGTGLPLRVQSVKPASSLKDRLLQLMSWKAVSKDFEGHYTIKSKSVGS